jgi:ABC-type sulfate transport system substrate-binding protein
LPGKDKFEIAVPSISILADPPVSVSDKVVNKRGRRPAAESLLKFVNSPQGQEIAASAFYRPRDPGVAAKHAAAFPKIQLSPSTISGVGERRRPPLQRWRRVRYDLYAMTDDTDGHSIPCKV